VARFYTSNLKTMDCASFLRILVTAAGIAISISAQTNSAQDLTRWFIVPGPHLQTGYSEADASDSRIRGEVVTSSASPRNHGSGDYRLYYTEWRDSKYFRPIQVTRSPAERIFSIFEPEVFYVGRRTTMSCSILTAIKRKNPLCLLNPIIFNVSW